MYYQDDDFNVVERVTTLAEQLEATPAQVALSWMLHRPGITAPIIGASKMAHLEQAVGAVDVMLSQEQMAFLEEPYRPHPVLGHS
jgi:aryl-alcohol dehydrogenase (NADP+)